MSNTASMAEADNVGELLSPSQTNRTAGDVALGRIRGARQSFSQSSTPLGMFHAYGSIGSSIPSMGDIRDGKFDHGGWSGPGQRRHSKAHRPTDFHVLHLHHQRTGTKKGLGVREHELQGIQNLESQIAAVETPTPHDHAMIYPNGYQFPPKHTKWHATKIGLRAFWKWFLTPLGFLITIYFLNVVAWGGMLFLIICGAAPAMCHPSCNYLYSAKKKWVEIDSQILNALFCVTGLGLIPWRFRDLYYLLQWRWRKNVAGLRRLAGIHREWFRLEGSQQLEVHLHPAEGELPAGTNEAALALPVASSPGPPLTGERAPPSVYWKLDFVIWAFVINTFLQIVLCGLMWGLTRFDRPGWLVGLVIGFAFLVAMAGGFMTFQEGRRVKKIEGVPVSKEDMELLKEMRSMQEV